MEEGQTYLSRCITLDSYQNSLDYVLDKTLLGDSFQIMRHLPPHSVDLIIADPPYNLTKAFHGNTFSKKKQGEYRSYTKAWLTLTTALLKDTGSLYVCCDWETSLIIGSVLQELCIVRNRITWQREKGRGAAAN